MDLLKVTKADAVAIYGAIIKLFVDNQIDYKSNLIGFAADGAAVMHGKNRSVAVLLKNECPNLFTFKCICHSFALCSSYACRKLPATVETMAREIYAYIQNSPKRSEKFSEIQILLNDKPKKILHPSQTRWLSLEVVVKRLLQLYDSLKMYFIYAVNADKLENAQTILNYLEEPVNELFLKFLSSILPSINNLNRLFQSESSQIHIVYTEVRRLVLNILDCFILPSYLELHDIEDIQFDNPENQCSLQEIYLGTAVHAQLSSETISHEQIQFYKTHCLKSYVELVFQIYQRFDFKSSQLKNLAWIGPKVVVSKKVRSIVELCLLFPNLISETDLQAADNEWREIRYLDF